MLTTFYTLLYGIRSSLILLNSNLSNPSKSYFASSEIVYCLRTLILSKTSTELISKITLGKILEMDAQRNKH